MNTRFRHSEAASKAQKYHNVYSASSADYPPDADKKIPPSGLYAIII